MLLEAAAQAFADHGYSGTRLVAVSAAAGANIAAISYHFGGKRSLYDAVLVASGKRFGQLFDELLSQGLSGGIEGLMSRVWCAMRTESDHLRIVMRAVLDDGQPPEGVTWMGRERLPVVCETWAPALGVTPDTLRMAIMSMNFLVSRYAIASTSDLRLLTGAETDDEINTRMVAHLTRLGRSLLGMPHEPGDV